MVNTIYLSLSENKLKQLNSNDVVTFDVIAYERLLYETGTCERHDFFEFIVTSSQISGYSSLQTYYVKTRSKRIPYVRCSVYDRDCNCIPLNSKTDIADRDNFLKSGFNNNPKKYPILSS